MEQSGAIVAVRSKERIFLLLITIIMLGLFIRLFYVAQRNFIDVDQRLADGTMVNLNAGKPAANLARLLQKGFYFDDPRDIAFIRKTIASKTTIGAQFDNIGELNKHDYYVNADDAFREGGKSFRQRVLVSRALIGFTGDDSLRFIQERRHPPVVPSVITAGPAGHSINGIILHNKQPVSGVLVRLQMVLPQDSIYNDEENDIVHQHIDAGNGYKKTYVLDEQKKPHLQSLIVYARTNNAGKYAFNKLPVGYAYQVLPLQPGFQFGRSQGTQNLDEDKQFNFIQSPHTIRLLSTHDFNILKKERSLIVRTPAQYNKWFWIIAVCFFTCFILLHLLFSWKVNMADQLLLPLVMILTGISFLTLLSLQDPLRDRFLAKDSLVYLGIGFLCIIAVLIFNIRRFTTDSWLYRLFIFKNSPAAANGWPWIAIAIGLLLATIRFGSGPEGSGVKVNLFGFQPSEIVKYMVILFLAGFFAANELFISAYASWRKRWQFFWFALIAIGITLFLFLMLGDLGPAMVILFTFIVLFSFSRGDFMFMALAVVFYVLVTWIFKDVWLSALLTVIMLIIGKSLNGKRLSESAIMALIVIAGFMTIDKIPHLNQLIPGPVQRLVDRKAIWQNAWDNEVYGGDQVANGLWAMAGGGLSGQGIGEGFAKTIPEAHTDMILPSVGEEFGWTGMVCIFLCFLLYLHRAIIIGRQTGTPFLFYLCAGIGVSTFVQFLLIAGGSTGALPLSGVSLPFLSYGGSSLVANMLAVGFLLSASRIKGTPVQMDFITKQQLPNNKIITWFPHY